MAFFQKMSSKLENLENKSKEIETDTDMKSRNVKNISTTENKVNNDKENDKYKQKTHFDKKKRNKKVKQSNENTNLKQVQSSKDITENSSEQHLNSQVDIKQSNFPNEANKDDHTTSTSEIDSKKTIKNAFAFMMCNRHKSIGQNSPGHERHDDTNDSSYTENRKKLALRKVVFEEWADSKGAKKRKREYQETGVIIEKKLRKRAKHFKQMLTQKAVLDDSESDQEELQIIETNIHKKTRPIQDSDSETDIKCKSDVTPNNSNNSISLDNSFRLQQTDLSSFIESVKNKYDNKEKKPNVKKLRKKRSKKSTFLTKELDSDSSACNTSSPKLQENCDLDEQKKNEAPETHLNEKGGTNTPRSYKHWQMRLKINVDDLNDEAVQDIIDLTTNLIDKEEIMISSSSSDSDVPLSSKSYCKLRNKGKCSQPIKVAPIFTKARSKPKIDLMELEARKKFLHSGVPENLKKIFDKHHRMEETEYQSFPTVSHIRIKPNEADQVNGRINFWNLPAANLNFVASKYCIPDVTTLNFLDCVNHTPLTETKSNLHKFQTITDLKECLERIKSENPNYPVYKTFRILLSKRQNNSKNQLLADTSSGALKNKKTKKSKKSKLQLKNNNTESIIPEKLSCNHEIWTDLYKPSSSEEIFGNRNSVNRIKNWLKTWLEYSEEINKQNRREKNSDCSSGSEFEGTDADSRDSLRLPGNALILCGPAGSGKTTAVYALCAELDINVLELNASTKRTGKRLLQELQEATQSHQVRKQQSTILSTFTKKDELLINHNTKKICLLLIEDVDIVFEQDESFLSSLTHLLVTSKRPMILTTTDVNCLHLKKFFMQYPMIMFVPFSSNILGPWLQVLCLVVGCDVGKFEIMELLKQNKGDARRTLLHLQFLAQTNCELINKDISLHEDLMRMEENSNTSWFNDEENSGDNFEIFNNSLLDLGKFWWNLSNFTNIPQPVIKINTENKVTETEDSKLKEIPDDLNTGAHRNMKKSTSSKNLWLISQIFDTLAMTDVMYEKLGVPSNLEPVHRLHSNRIKDGIDLNQSLEAYSVNRELSYDITCTLLDGNVRFYNEMCSNNSDMPKQNESSLQIKRWRIKQYKCTDALKEIIPVSYHLERNAVSTDYCTVLRTMARTEAIRAKLNNKRNNRFYNYLQGLGINYQKSVLETACHVFGYK